MATAALTGTAISGSPLSKADIVAGGKTIIITLTGDVWDGDTELLWAAGAGNELLWASNEPLIHAPTTGFESDDVTSLRSSMDSDKAEAAGWDALVKGAAHTISRDSDTQATITLAAIAGYDITADETITTTLVAGLLDSGVAIVATETFVVAADVTATTKGGGKTSRRTSHLRRLRRQQEAIQRDDEEILALLIASGVFDD